MTKITKEQVLENLDEVKKYITEAEQKTEEKKKVVIEIKNRWTGAIKFTSEKSTIKEAVEEAVVDNKANLIEANLIGSNLSGSNLSGSNLREANLSGSNLSDASLIGANLYGSNLSGSNLSGSNLREANLYGSDLRGANLSGAELNCAKFYGKGGTTKIKKNQVDDFFKALGIIVES